MSDQQFLQPQLTEAAIGLGKNLVAAEVYIRYQQAGRALNADAMALGLLNKLNLAQARIRKAQRNGTITPADLQTLGDLQTQVEATPVILELFDRQQEMLGFFQQVNAEISQLLGINFALIARRSSCC